MTLTIKLTPEEETQLKTVASVRGMEPEEHAHTLLANVLRGIRTSRQEGPPDQDEFQRLTDATKSGDLAARLKLMEMTPTIPAVDPETGEPTPLMSREMARSEFIYQD